MKRVDIVKLFLLLSFGFTLQGQEMMYINFLQDSAAVGETVDLIVTLEQDPSNRLSGLDLTEITDMLFFPPAMSQGDSVKTSKADVEILDLGQWSDENNDQLISGEELQWQRTEKGDQVLYQNRIKLAFFDVGIYAFEGFTFQYDGQNSKTNRALIKINFKDYDLEVVDSTGLAPIKNIEKEPLKIQDFLPYLLYILLPILLIYGIYQYFQKKKQEAITPEPEIIIIPPDEKALNDLKELKEKQLWQKGEIKQYQSELSHIIREYLEGRYHIKALESTTTQIIKSIKDKSFTKDDQLKLQRILQIADLVKFAKAKPNVNIHEEFMNEAIEFVERTKEEEEETVNHQEEE